MPELMAGKYSKINNAYKLIVDDNPKNLITIEIGDTKQPSQFYPQVKLCKWGDTPDDNEVNFSVRLNNTVEQIPIEKEGILETNNIKFYQLENAFEFEITLDKRPKSNVIEFTMQSKGLKFSYQPIELTQLEIDNNCSRPDNVKGSYAVYYDTCPKNIVGGKVYGTGKVAHIYRPKIVDAIGKTTWGELNISNGILTVTIPKIFLSKATYPVTHAAGLTIGYETAGASALGVAADRMYCASGSQINPGTSGDISKLTASVFAGAVNYKAIIFDYSTATIISNGVGTATADSLNWTQHWEDLPFGATKPQFGSSTYSIGLIGDGGVNFYYDSTSPYYVDSDLTNSYSSPQDPTGFAHNGWFRVSCYATYVAAALGNNNGFFSFF